MKKDITIYDIAKEFEVSPSTVSRALKGHSSIGKTTSKKIQEYADRHGYQINSVAAKLRSKKTYTIGVIVTWINQPFLASIISGIESVAREKGYNVIISQTYDQMDLEQEVTKNMLNSRVEGVIVSLAIGTTSFEHFQPFVNRGIPLVFVDRVPMDFSSDKVIIDNFQSAFMATEHLILGGCKRIGHITGSGKFIFKQRQEGYIAALQKHGLPVDESLIASAPVLNEENGVEMAKKLLESEDRPDGIFAAIDMAAVSAIQVAKKIGLHVPEDLAVVGFNNDPISSVVDPALTTISQPPVEMGKVAANHVLSEEKKSFVETVTLPTELVVRESTTKIKW